MEQVVPYIEFSMLAAILIAQAIGNRRMNRLEREAGTVRRALVQICDGNRRAAMRILAGRDHPDQDTAA